MASFSDYILSDMDVFFNETEFAVSAIYNSFDREYVDVACSVFLDHESVLQPQSLDVEIVEIGITIEAKYVDVGSPGKGSEFEINGTTYTVQRIESNDKTTVRMWVTENES